MCITVSFSEVLKKNKLKSPNISFAGRHVNGIGNYHRRPLLFCKILLPLPLNIIRAVAFESSPEEGKVALTIQLFELWPLGLIRINDFIRRMVHWVESHVPTSSHASFSPVYGSNSPASTTARWIRLLYSALEALKAYGLLRFLSFLRRPSDLPSSHFS